MGRLILIVDDSASMRQLVTFSLKYAGYDVIAAVDGKDALITENDAALKEVSGKSAKKTEHADFHIDNIPELDLSYLQLIFSARNHIKELLHHPDKTNLQRAGEIITFLKKLSPQQQYARRVCLFPGPPLQRF